MLFRMKLRRLRVSPGSFGIQLNARVVILTRRTFAKVQLEIGYNHRSITKRCLENTHTGCPAPETHDLDASIERKRKSKKEREKERKTERERESWFSPEFAVGPPVTSPVFYAESRIAFIKLHSQFLR